MTSQVKPPTSDVQIRKLLEASMLISFYEWNEEMETERSVKTSICYLIGGKYWSFFQRASFIYGIVLNCMNA